MNRVARSIAAIAFAAALPLCASAAAPDAQRLHHHPLYGMLIQLDRQIAALRATIGTPGLAYVGATAAGAAREADDDLSTAAQREGRIMASAGADGSDERKAFAALAHGGDAGGLDAYRGSLQQSRSAALSAYSRSLDTRVARAYARRAAQFAEAESTLAFELERRDAGATLPLRVKLADLRPDPQTRTALRRRLAAILARESAAVALLHAKNQASLAQYRSSLIASSQSDYSTESGQASARTAGNLRARAGAGDPSPGALPSWRPYGDEDAGAVANAAASFQKERTQVAARSRQIVRIDSESTRATLAQIAALQAERRALYDEIVRSLRCKSRDSGCPA